MKRIITHTIALFVMPTWMLAQTNLSGEFRPRAEYRHGFKNLLPDGVDAAFQVSQRTRLNWSIRLTVLRPV